LASLAALIGALVLLVWLSGPGAGASADDGPEKSERAADCERALGAAWANEQLGLGVRYCFNLDAHRHLGLYNLAWGAARSLPDQWKVGSANLDVLLSPRTELDELPEWMPEVPATLRVIKRAMEFNEKLNDKHWRECVTDPVLAGKMASACSEPADEIRARSWRLNWREFCETRAKYYEDLRPFQTRLRACEMLLEDMGRPFETGLGGASSIRPEVHPQVLRWRNWANDVSDCWDYRFTTCTDPLRGPEGAILDIAAWDACHAKTYRTCSQLHPVPPYFELGTHSTADRAEAE
jgi:hypothetical protein